MKTTTHSFLSLLLTFLLTTLAFGRGGGGGGGGGGRSGHGNQGGGSRSSSCGSCTWKSIERNKSHTGLTSVRVEDMLKQCRKNGLSPEEAKNLLNPVLTANQEELPAECVFTKIEEGLTKKANPSAIAQVAQARLECLRKAKKLLDETGATETLARRSGTKRLLEQLCLTMESGIPSENLQALLNMDQRNPTFCHGRLLRVLALGETLSLAGFPPEESQKIMKDCRRLNIDGAEIQRVGEYLIQQRKKGVDFETLYKRLWLRPPTPPSSQEKKGNSLLEGHSMPKCACHVLSS